MKNIDIFGTLFNFTIERNKKFKTSFGGFLTIMTAGICFLMSFLFGRDFYYRLNPKVLEQKIIPENYEKILIGNDNITFAWRIEDKFGNPIDFKNKIYPKLQYHYFYMNKSDFIFQEGETIDIEIQKCKSLKKINEKFKKDNDLDKWYCLDYDAFEANFGGYWNNDFLYYYSLSISTCNDPSLNKTFILNETDNTKIPNCVEFEKLKEFIENEVYLSIMFPQIIFSYNNIENPFQTIYYNFFRRLDIKLSRYETCEYNTAILEDDRGWMFKTEINSTGLNYLKCDLTLSYKEDTQYEKPVEIYLMELYLNRSVTFSKRTFMKLQELAAITGGFVNIVMLIFNLISLYVNQFERDKMFIDYLFKYSRSEDKDIYKNNTFIEKLNKINSLRDHVSLSYTSNNKLKRNNVSQNINTKRDNIEMINLISGINEKKNDSVKDKKNNNLSISFSNSNDEKSLKGKENNNSKEYLNTMEKDKYFQNVREDINEDEDKNKRSIMRKKSENSVNNIDDLKKLSFQNVNDNLNIADNKKNYEKIVQINEESHHNLEENKLNKIPADIGDSSFNNSNNINNLNNSIFIENENSKRNFLTKNFENSDCELSPKLDMEIKNDKININLKQNLNEKVDKSDKKVIIIEEYHKKSEDDINIKSLIEKSKSHYGNFSLKEFICFKFCKNSQKKLENKRFYSFILGRNGITDKLDLLKYLKLIQMSKIVSKILLNREQAFFIKYYYKYFIDVDGKMDLKNKEIKKERRFEKMIRYIKKSLNKEINEFSQTETMILKNLFNNVNLD